MVDPLAHLWRLATRKRRASFEGVRIAGPVREHPVIAGAVATAAVLAGTVGMLLRRMLTDSTRPTPGVLAEATAVSVWDAAKGSVIAEVRAAGEAADVRLVASASRAAVLEAASAGADVTAAALGAVEGALAVPHLLGASPREVATTAADAAIGAARELGEHAAVRVEQSLMERFPAELRRLT